MPITEGIVLLPVNQRYVLTWPVDKPLQERQVLNVETPDGPKRFWESAEALEAQLQQNTKKEQRATSQKCPTCKGKGFVGQSPFFSGSYEQSRPGKLCPTCKGAGS